MELEEHQNGANPPQNDTETTTIDNTTANQQPQQEDAFVSASESLSESDHPTTSNDTEKPTPKSPKTEDTDIEDDEDEEDPPPKKQKQLSSLTQKQELPEPMTAAEIENNNDSNGATEFNKPTQITPTTATTKKKSKKKNNNNVWVTRSTRKGKKKTKPNPQNTPSEDTVLITPVPRCPDKSDDTPDLKICLSKVYKAEKVELSEDRLSAGSIKGYRMVRATRGVSEGAWYFEIKVVSLGETGHTRLGWSTEKGDLQAPVGYDGNSFGYRDIDGSKVHKALREKYGEEGYKEGDVIGFYISLPEGELYTPIPAHLVWYKGQRYVCAPDAKEDPPKIVPGEILFLLFCLPGLKDEVMKITPVQKQTRASQRTRFKAFVIVGDGNGHVGLGVKCLKEVATAIRGVIILAKLSIIPVRRGYWGNKIGQPHTVPFRSQLFVLHSVFMFHLKELFFYVSFPLEEVVLMALPFWVGHCLWMFLTWLSSGGVATFDCLLKTYGFLTPDFWTETRFTKSPFQEYTDLLGKPTKALVLEDVERVEA
ncbi:unnamed protein product [Dovyalis caffra]|uniref:B30.2/SPRY domain-containing protein n=1 Tax=Dovyalis caffra TaxID=77055 RepID=A0AAV1R925_9ROSI|nr:unnamed protein product [Dovyalis caffra]